MWRHVATAGGRRAIPTRQHHQWGYLGGISVLFAYLLITAWVRYQLTVGSENQIRQQVIEELRPDDMAKEKVTTVV